MRRKTHCMSSQYTGFTTKISLQQFRFKKSGGKAGPRNMYPWWERIKPGNKLSNWVYTCSTYGL